MHQDREPGQGAPFRSTKGAGAMRVGAGVWPFQSPFSSSCLVRGFLVLSWAQQNLWVMEEH